MKKIFVIAAAIFFAIDSTAALACSCGSSILGVGLGSSLLPTKKGGLVSLQYDDVDQTSSSIHKKDTQFYTLNGQYLFNRKWGVAASVPYVHRKEYRTSNGSNSNSSIGDVQIRGIYSGLSKDMSSGLTFGLKLPTGATKQNNFDRDTQIGTGSYDLILGAYNFGQFKGSNLGWIAQANLQKVLVVNKSYRTGDELSASLGGFYDMGKILSFSRVAPMFQISGTTKKEDNGYNSSNVESYRRIFVGPAIDVTIDDFKIYTDVQFPIYSHNGGQLRVDKIFRFIIGRSF